MAVQRAAADGTVERRQVWRKRDGRARTYPDIVQSEMCRDDTAPAGCEQKQRVVSRDSDRRVHGVHSRRSAAREIKNDDRVVDEGWIWRKKSIDSFRLPSGYQILSERKGCRLNMVHCYER